MIIKSKLLLRSIALYTFFISIVFIYAENKYPVILVHGNGGWGRTEKTYDGKYFYYWGGEVDLQEGLKNAGYDVRTAIVGPFSSNWDRACELYAHLTGAEYIDYGAYHSRKFGFDRRKVRVSSSEGWANVWDGALYEEWGKVNNEGINKIHLIGHSQGGQTVRLLAQLLEEGMPSEVEAVLGKNYTNEMVDRAVREGRLSPLFTGRHHNGWVKSVSTFATPNDGTTSADVVNYAGDFIPFFSTPINGKMMDKQGKVDNTNFSLKLYQWDIRRRNGESFTAYFNRVMNSAWRGTSNFSNFDLSTYGARQMNSWVKDQANIYYFSYSCSATTQKEGSLRHEPAEHINETFKLNATIMGSYTNLLTGINSEWHENDGYVNTISQNAPKIGRSKENINEGYELGEKAEVGKWNVLPLLSKTDHEDIIGRNTLKEMVDLITFYGNFINNLYKLGK